MKWASKEDGGNGVMQAAYVVPDFSTFEVNGKWYVRTPGGYAGAYDSEAKAAESAKGYAKCHDDQVARERRQAELYWALRSRVLTAEEMATVQQYDYRLLIFNMQSYNEQDKRHEFNDALLQQFKLRLAAETK